MTVRGKAIVERVVDFLLDPVVWFWGSAILVGLVVAYVVSTL